MEWNEYFLNIVEQIKLKSKDESTQVGALIVNDENTIVSTGYNSFPRGLNDNLKERQERPIKYYYIEHAERNAIFNAVRLGVSTKNTTIYLTSGLPCADCARAIINSGIKKIYCKETCTTKNKEKWFESQQIALEMLNECGVDVIYY